MQTNLIALLSLLQTIVLFSQGDIEATKVKADSLIGDGSRITGITPQVLSVSASGDTLHISEGNFVIIPGLSSSNSGNAFANAGGDIVNACQTSFNLNASPLAQGNTGLWTIESGIGGNLINASHPNATFVGQEGETYLLKWTVQHPEGSSSFDQLNITIAINTETSAADAGQDLFAIMEQTVTLNGNAPEAGSTGRWEILSGGGGVLADDADPSSTSKLKIPEQAEEFFISDILLDGFPDLPNERERLRRLEIQSSNLLSLPSLEAFNNLKILNLNSNALLKITKLPFMLQEINLYGNPIICVENKPPLVEDQLAEYEICPQN